MNAQRTSAAPTLFALACLTAAGVAVTAAGSQHVLAYRADPDEEWYTSPVDLAAECDTVFQSIVEKDRLVAGFLAGHISLEAAVDAHERIAETPRMQAGRRLVFPAATDRDSRRAHVLGLAAQARRCQPNGPQGTRFCVNDGEPIH